MDSSAFGVHPLKLRPLTTSAFGIALWAMGLAGCEKPEEIRVYTVAKPPPTEHKASDRVSSTNERDERIPDREFAQGNLAGPSAPAVPTEMLGAITPQGKRTWFFKLSGPIAAVGEVKKPFAEFVRSVRFTEKGPEWDLPEGWKSEAGSQMRYATIRVDTTKGPLEMSVIPLPTGDGNLEKYVLANVNRWRDQLGLGPLTESGLSDSKEIIKIELNGSPIWVADFIGESKGNPMGAPFAGKAAAKRDPAATSSPGKLPFDYQVPEGWTAGRVGQFQLAAFDVRDGNREANITISTAGGDRTANINRWRGQLELDPLTAADIDRQARKITVDGHEGLFVEATAPESAKTRETILGVIVEADGKQWFIKLKGDTDLASREKDRFEQFVKSIKFR